MSGLIGKKIGMTSVFNEDGKNVESSVKANTKKVEA